MLEFILLVLFLRHMSRVVFTEDGMKYITDEEIAERRAIREEIEARKRKEIEDRPMGMGDYWNWPSAGD